MLICLHQYGKDAEDEWIMMQKKAFKYLRNLPEFNDEINRDFEKKVMADVFNCDNYISIFS